LPNFDSWAALKILGYKILGYKILGYKRETNHDQLNYNKLLRVYLVSSEYLRDTGSMYLNPKAKIILGQITNFDEINVRM
jgi:hypothetical protein